MLLGHYCVKYIHITSNSKLPNISNLKPYKCVVVINDKMTESRQAEISSWLVTSGCLYMMAWGNNCSSWDDSVDLANLEQFDFGVIPNDKFVMTTWHESAPLKEAFEHCKYAAHHPIHDLDNVVILHLAEQASDDRYKQEYIDA